MLYYRWLGTKLDEKLKDKIEVYSRGTQNRQVVDTDYYMGDVIFNEKIMKSLESYQGGLETRSSRLKERNLVNSV